jgi:hypothetical protein
MDAYERLVFPKYVGSYRVGGNTGVLLMLVRKPCWFRRTMVRLVLGWEWVDG